MAYPSLPFQPVGLLKNTFLYPSRWRNSLCLSRLFFQLCLILCSYQVISQYNTGLQCIHRNVCVGISSPDSTIALEFTFEIESNRVGWVAVGWGNNTYMPDSTMAIAYLYDDHITVSLRTTEAYVEPEALDDQRVTVVNSGHGPGQSEWFVVFRVREDDHLKREGEQEFIWAISLDGATSITSRNSRPGGESVNALTASIPMHDRVGSFLLDPLQTPTSVASGNNASIVSQIHGISLTIFWIGLCPFAIYIARYSRKILPNHWLTLHIGIIIVCVFGTVIAVAVVIPKGVDISGPHFYLGLLALATITAQVILGLHARKFVAKGHVMSVIHARLGWFIFFLSSANVFVGVARSGGDTKQYIASGVTLGIMLGLLAYGETDYRNRTLLAERNRIRRANSQRKKRSVKARRFATL